MAIQGETVVDLKTFLRKMRANGHRQETVDFVERIAGQEIDRFQFLYAYKDAVKTKASRSKAGGLFEYLAACGVIRINEQ